MNSNLLNSKLDVTGILDLKLNNDIINLFFFKAEETFVTIKSRNWLIFCLQLLFCSLPKANCVLKNVKIIKKLRNNSFNFNLKIDL